MPAALHVIGAGPNGTQCVSVASQPARKLACYPDLATATAASKGTIYAGETGRFRVRGTVRIYNAWSDTETPDTVSAVIRTTSPIDPNDVTWITPPGFCMPSQPDCGADNERREVPMDIETYSASRSATPQVQFRPPRVDPATSTTWC